MIKLAVHSIVFNGASVLPSGMLAACYKNIYPFVDQILIAEGAVRPTSSNPGDATWASTDGRSTDQTISIIKSLDDPENKIKLIQKDGFWNGKLEMVNALAKETKDDITYVIQLDTDEFYLHDDMIKIIQYLDVHRPDQVHFYANFFWGDRHNIIDPHLRSWANSIPWKRWFKHSPGDRWTSHAPPIYGSNGNNVFTRDMTLAIGVKLFHYAYVIRSQAEFKGRYYKNSGVDYVGLFDKWKKDQTTSLVHNERTISFINEHPKIIKELYFGTKNK